MPSKGDQFSATSPLSQEAKEFFLQFSNSSEERVLNPSAMNAEKLVVFHAQRSAGSERPKKAAQRKLQARWSEQHGAVRINGTSRGWWNLIDGQSPKGTYGREPPAGWPQTPPAWEHAELWGRDKKVCIAVSQPYPWVLNKDIDCLNDFADEYGLRFRISNYPSWYRPGRCWFVEWFRDDAAERS